MKSIELNEDNSLEPRSQASCVLVIRTRGYSRRSSALNALQIRTGRQMQTYPPCVTHLCGYAHQLFIMYHAYLL